jgi:hypothetical protein
VFSACRWDGRREQCGSAALVTIAQQPGRAQITDIKRQGLSPPDAGRTHWIRGFMAFQLALAPELVVL